ncbi:ABC transporter ATP-binding protein [Anaerobacillus isosaccharinicus]|uniref:ABC transporter ATP-binding protein n=1 Tax=Anaerobacillus isosaccharinicus TaxID=1532552 RepID=A0A1S2LE36_9BACI|nr:ABC transporter ATP-binding protein [Anaerobacillus isosaccharinicus]MBA5586767.1 ABC transporter ATP-binding protein [Anaerobacillus isosaccharinicus]QOY35015.1 ABC transporter ATP-binding protein [Anaerobacillus isosaccharinicus]
MSNVTLSVKGLKKEIKGKKIIKGIDFELKEGEVFGFLGPNGSGKTTTIRMIVGLIKPTAGSVEICGYDIQKNFTRAMENLGCIVENPELYPYLTGWENLKLFSGMMKEIKERRLQEVVQLVGLTKRINDKVSTYSLGMKQRLGIAQALLGKPKILILDEPTNGLDPSGIREMRELIKFLATSENLSVFVSSHLLSEIQLMCDRVAIISNGAVLKVGEVRSLMSEQEELLWRVSPIEEAMTVFTLLEVEARVFGEYISTPYREEDVGEWNRKLVERGVTVTEITRKVPALEELFLQLTGGESID